MGQSDGDRRSGGRSGPIGVLRLAIGWLDQNIEYYLNFIFYMYLTWIVVIEVFRRYVLGSATSYGEETARYAFIWLAYIAAARCVRGRRHLSIEILRENCGRTGKFLLFLISDAAFLALALIVVWTSVKYVGTAIEYGQYFTGIDVPLWVAIISVPAGWTLIAIRVVQRSILTVDAYRKGMPMENGGLGSV